MHFIVVVFLLLCVGAHALPDLVVNHAALTSTLSLDERTQANGCSRQEGCVSGEGRRKLIRFTTTLENVGENNLVIGAPPAEPEDDSEHMTDGNWEWLPCHSHWRAMHWVRYDLLVTTSGELVNDTGATGGRSFCLSDHICKHGAHATFTCSNQGITANCSASHLVGVPCQWIDITDIDQALNELTLRVTVNPDALYAESNYSNNIAEIKFHVSKLPRYSHPASAVVGVVSSILFLLCCVGCCVCCCYLVCKRKDKGKTRGAPVQPSYPVSAK